MPCDGQGVFSMAMSAVPKWDGFVTALKAESEDDEATIVAQIGDFVKVCSHTIVDCRIRASVQC